MSRARRPLRIQLPLTLSSHLQRALRDCLPTRLSSTTMSAADTPKVNVTEPPLTDQDLARVENALEDIHLKEVKQDGALAGSVPPTMFGAGGPMSVCYRCPMAGVNCRATG